MNKRVPGIILIIILSFIPITARELRTPWSLQRGAQHWPFPRPVIDCDQRWIIDTWGGGLHRQSDKAYLNKETTKTENLSALIFGKENFVVADIFSPETVVTNPLLSTLLISPRISYNENSAYFGFKFAHKVDCEGCLQAGVRSVLTFRAIRTGLDDEMNLAETIEDVRQLQNDRIDGTALAGTISPTIQDINNTGGHNGPAFAYRMDFVNSLYLSTAGVPPFPKFLNFHDTSKTPADVTVNGSADIISNTTNNPVHLIKSITKPIGVYSAIQPVVNAALPFLNADGTNGTEGQRMIGFDQAIDYTPLATNTDAQRQLWFVPTLVAGGAANNIITVAPIAATMRDNIEQIIKTLDTPINFLKASGIDFSTQHIEGAGDWDNEFFINYQYCNTLLEGFVGVRLPTGRKIKHPNRVFSIFSTGNNRHFEFRLGGVATWQPNDWFIAKIDALWSQVFRGNEKVAAPFAGATVKNIGPTIDANISWNWLQANLDFTFLVPASPCVGMTAGYEVYYKSSDKVSLKTTTATDFLGNIQPLDASVLEYRTNVTAHKVRTEFFHQGDNWELFAGWAHVFAGKNAPKETDWHIGLVSYF